MSAPSRPRAELLRFCGWLFICNALVMALIGLRYLFYLPAPDSALALIYILIAYPGHFAQLGFLPMLLLAPLILLLPKPHLIRPLAIFIAAASSALLLLDTLVFAENRFHLNALTVAILGWRSWLFAGIYLIIFIVLLSLLAVQIGKWLRARRLRRGPWLAMVLVVCILTTHVMHIWADARYYVPITSMTPYLPLFYPQTAKRFLTRHNIMDVTANRDRGAVNSMIGQSGDRLDYPLKPLACNQPAPHYNTLLILVDAMRGDSLRPEWTPNMSTFAGKASNFERHYSGGNSSRIGVFSLFYGLPATYWSDFDNLQLPPVLVDQFQTSDYRFGMFTSKPMYRPTNLDRTVFASLEKMPGVPDGGKDYELDRNITDRWLDWLDRQDTAQPFFGFLFYDSLNHQDFPPDYPRIAEPDNGSELARKRADYATSVHFIDSLVGEVLADLRQRGLLDETVVVISSDHGQEFDDSGLGYVGYGSNYSRHQLHVPLIVHWPGREPERVTKRTAHRDIPVTLLTRLFGCSNPPGDYSTGADLFTGQPWQWLVSGSYHDHAVIEPDARYRDSSRRLLRDPRQQLSPDQGSPHTA
ncbi:MAG: DUF3413 domain-containing protein [Gammaproteobacteria bacterium]|nr:DUF3413 domain-containing protein [Gammaproteobacteria bacterium]